MDDMCNMCGIDFAHIAHPLSLISNFEVEMCKGDLVELGLEFVRLGRPQARASVAQRRADAEPG